MIYKMTIPIRARPMGRPRAVVMGRGRSARILTPLKDRVWQDKAAILIIQERPQRVLIGMTSIKAWFYFSPPKSWSKKKRAEAMNNTTIRPQGKEGDLDNLAKNLLDVLQTVHLLENDKDVVSMDLAKFYGEPERIELEIRVYG